MPPQRVFPHLPKQEFSLMKTSVSKAPTHLVVIMLFLVYISWGSVYIGNKLSLEVAGPFLVSGLRNALAGLLTLAVCFTLNDRSEGMWRRPSLHDIWTHALMGILMVTFAGGGLVLGQTYVSSGVAAVVMSSTPIFMLVSAFLFGGEPAPNKPQCAGMITGACAISYLSWSEQSAGTGSILGVLILLCSIGGWVGGSLVMKRVNISKEFSTMESTGLILLMGGLQLLIIGFLSGEQHSLHPENIRFDTILGFGWMVVGGSFIAYVSYLWLLAHVPVSLAVSYEYVVPVIGLYLGWLIGGETVTPSMACACAVSIASVFLVVRHRHSFKSYIRHYMITRHRQEQLQKQCPRQEEH